MIYLILKSRPSKGYWQLLANCLAAAPCVDQDDHKALVALSQDWREVKRLGAGLYKQLKPFLAAGPPPNPSEVALHIAYEFIRKRHAPITRKLSWLDKHFGA
jgi:hypothetical protein